MTSVPQGDDRILGEHALGVGAECGGSNAPDRSIQPRTSAEVQDWLVSHLAEALHVEPEKIDVAAPFETLGLDSVTAVGMTGHLQDWLGCSVDPTVVFDYPTIETLAQHLAERTQSG